MLCLALFAPVTAYAASTSNGSSGAACDAVSSISPGSGTCDAPTGPTPQKLIRTALNLLSLVAGVIAVIMLIVGGLKYITSGGDSNAAASARNTILYAIVGIVVVAFAQVIVKFVLKKAS